MQSKLLIVLKTIGSIVSEQDGQVEGMIVLTDSSKHEMFHDADFDEQ